MACSNQQCWLVIYVPLSHHLLSYPQTVSLTRQSTIDQKLTTVRWLIGSLLISIIITPLFSFCQHWARPPGKKYRSQDISEQYFSRVFLKCHRIFAAKHHSPSKNSLFRQHRAGLTTGGKYVRIFSEHCFILLFWVKYLSENIVGQFLKLDKTHPVRIRCSGHSSAL